MWMHLNGEMKPLVWEECASNKKQKKKQKTCIRRPIHWTFGANTLSGFYFSEIEKWLQHRFSSNASHINMRDAWMQKNDEMKEALG